MTIVPFQRTPTNPARQEPESIDAAREEYEAESAELMEIQAQLAARPKPLQVTRQEFIDWQTWHGKAAAAATHKGARVAFLKRWIRAQENGPQTDIKYIVRQMAVLLQEITGDDISDLTPEAQEAARALGKWLAAFPTNH
jgi:hypothetical protein